VKKRWGTWMLDILGMIIVVITAFPFIWLALTSIKQKKDQLSWPPNLLPKSLTFEHYKTIFSDLTLLNGLTNTVIIAAFSTVLSVLIGTVAAYSLSRVSFTVWIRNTLLTWILVTRIYPAIATAIPFFLMMKNLGLIDTHLALIITYTGFNLPFVIWLAMGFFNSIPKSIDESALIDGCNIIQRFYKIILPLSKPGIVAVTIFSFNLSWNEFLYAIILTTDKAKTMPTVIAGFITDKGYEFGMMSSLSILLLIPVIVLSIFTQTQMIRGLTLGAVKG
jgi:multiple sugar transport system permease protein